MENRKVSINRTLISISKGNQSYSRLSNGIQKLIPLGKGGHGDYYMRSGIRYIEMRTMWA